MAAMPGIRPHDSANFNFRQQANDRREGADHGPHHLLLTWLTVPLICLLEDDVGECDEAW